jgi:nucleotide-binding universal stress UspA family protein
LSIKEFKMKEFKRILFPVDLSETSSKLVPYVATMAQKFGAEIHLLFVARIFDYFSSVYVPQDSIDKFANDLLEGAKRRLEEFRAEYFETVPSIRAVVIPGDASEEILNYVQLRKIDMLILGTHGRKGLDKIVFGSVAERVAKAAPVPVLLVNPYRSRT